MSVLCDIGTGVCTGWFLLKNKQIPHVVVCPDLLCVAWQSLCEKQTNWVGAEWKDASGMLMKYSNPHLVESCALSRMAAVSSVIRVPAGPQRRCAWYNFAITHWAHLFCRYCSILLHLSIHVSLFLKNIVWYIQVLMLIYAPEALWHHWKHGPEHWGCYTLAPLAQNELWTKVPSNWLNVNVQLESAWRVQPSIKDKQPPSFTCQ